MEGIKTSSGVRADLPNESALMAKQVRHLTLEQLGFDRRKFEVESQAAGLACAQIWRVLERMKGAPKITPDEAWESIRSTPAGRIVRSLFKQTPDFTTFCLRLCKETICPPEYFIGIYKLLRSGGDDEI